MHIKSLAHFIITTIMQTANNIILQVDRQTYTHPMNVGQVDVFLNTLSAHPNPKFIPCPSGWPGWMLFHSNSPWSCLLLHIPRPFKMAFLLAIVGPTAKYLLRRNIQLYGISV